MRHGIRLALLVVFCLSLLDARPLLAQDPLPSWNEGPAKKSILDFVAKVTKEGSPDFVPVPQRIATFDNDGTLWAEQPIYVQVAFALDRAKALVEKKPELRDKEPFKTVVSGDLKALATLGEKGLIEIIAATHTGMTVSDFEATVRDWISTAKHPRFNRPYTELVYQPMLELLAYLRANQFKTFIVSGGGIDFMRPWAPRVYGIPLEQIVGSSGKLKFEMRDGKGVLLKLSEIELIDDGPGKPAGIQRSIGQRPIMAFGNSDGDLQMLQFTTTGTGPRFGLIVHHTDAEREWAYDRRSHVGKLDKALDEGKQRGWTIVDMKKDWKKIFPFDK